MPELRQAGGELKNSELGSRFPYYVKRNARGWSTDLVRLPGIAIKLWNEAKVPKAAKAKRMEIKDSRRSPAEGVTFLTHDVE